MNKKKWLCIFLCTALGMTALLGGFPAFGERKVSNSKRPVVVLDPGHGGGEAGAWAKHNGITYKEEEINWKISNYTMQELQKAGNIEVHLTRSYHQRMGLRARVEVAKSLEADLLVSQHINSSPSASPRGASVMISRGTYRPYLVKKEKKFGSYVMEELGNLGIHRRFPETGGMEYRMSENNSRYPNGGLRDYYGIVASSVEMDLPGVIIEHAFISSPMDAKEFLSSDAKLRRLAKADARAILRYCKTLPQEEIPTPQPDPEPGKKNGWYKENGHQYYYENGKKIKNKLLFLKAGISYVDKEGKRQYGWQEFKGKTYYFKPDGIAHCNWMNDHGTWYYFDIQAGYLYKDKLMKMGNGDIYYMDKNGVRFNKGFRTIKSGKKSHTYFFGPDGKARKGWMKLNKKWYYFTKNAGVMLKNTKVKSSSGKIYKFNSKGVCTNRK